MMRDTVTILAFGKLTDVLPARSEFSWKGGTMGDLREELEQAFPELTGKTFNMALNHSMAPLDVQVSSGAEIALLPPFSGG